MNSQKKQEVKVHSEKIKLLYSGFRTSFYANIAAALCFAAVQWQVIDHTRILIWLFPIILLTLFRGYLLLNYQKANPDAEDMKKWELLFLVGTASAGILWGLGSILLFPENNPEHQIIVALVMLVMAAGAMINLGIVPKALLLFITPTMLPVLPLYFLQGNNLTYLVILMILFSYYFFLKSAKNTSEITEQNIRARLYSQTREKEQSEKSEKQLKVLQENEKIHQTILDNNPDGVIFVNQFGAIELINKKFEEMTGFRNRELLGQLVERIIPGRFGNHKSLRNAYILNPKSKTMGEDRLLYVKRKDGSEFTADIALSPMNMNGESYTVAYIHDITLRQQKELELNEVRRQAELLMNSTAEAIYGIDMEGNCTFCNPACIKMLGYESSSDLIGKHMHNLIHHTFQDGTSYPEHQCKIYKALNENQKVHDDTEVFFKADGSSFNAEYWSYPIHNNEQLIGAVVTFFDISQRKEAERRLSHYKHITETSRELLSFFDSDYVHRAANSSYLHAHQVSEEEVIGKTVAEIIKDEEIVTFIEDNIDRCLRGENVFHSRKHSFTGIGLRYFDISYSRYIGESHKDTGVIVSMRDITEEKKYQEEQRNLEIQLFNSQKMDAIGKLTAGIAHDFNNILTGILGYSHLGLSLGKDDDDLTRYLTAIQHGGERGKDMIEKMLAYSRNKPSETSLESPLPLIEKAIHLIQPGLRKNIDLNISASDQIPAVNLDPVEFEQVIINLCFNARDAMNGKGKIDIDISPMTLKRECDSCHGTILGNFLDISIHDDGPGISPGVMSKIFDPFYSTKKEGEGTGLGLSMVHGIIHNCDGHIFVESEPGTGTTFHLLLPVPTDEKASTEDSQSVATETEHQHTIMVVDDDEMVASFLREVLKMEGYNTVTFTDSQEAMVNFRRNPLAIDMIITDQVMPGLTGIELSEEILIINPTIPIFIISGYSGQLTPKVARKKGIREYFSKPINKDELLEKIAEVLKTIH